MSKKDPLATLRRLRAAARDEAARELTQATTALAALTLEIEQLWAQWRAEQATAADPGTLARWAVVVAARLRALETAHAAAEQAVEAERARLRARIAEHRALVAVAAARARADRRIAAQRAADQLLDRIAHAGAVAVADGSGGERTRADPGAPLP